MSSDRRSVEGALPDGVVPEGAERNPNPPEEVAANRARFDAKQRELQHDRQEAAEQIREVQAEREDQYRQSMAHAGRVPGGTPVADPVEPRDSPPGAAGNGRPWRNCPG